MQKIEKLLTASGPNYDNDIGYRSEEEFLEWKKKDPLLKFNDLKESERQKIKEEIQAQIDDAFDFAEKSPFPSQDELAHGIYS